MDDGKNIPFVGWLERETDWETGQKGANEIYDVNVSSMALGNLQYNIQCFVNRFFWGVCL